MQMSGGFRVLLRICAKWRDFWKLETMQLQDCVGTGLIPLAGIHDGDVEFGILDDEDDYGATGDGASASDEDDARVNSHSSNEDGWIDRDRSPASSSACNSLEWDTHADDLFLHAPRLSPYRHPSGHK